MSEQVMLPQATTAQVRAELRNIVREYRGRFAVVIGLFAASALAGLVAPRAVGLLVDRLQAGASVGEVAAYGVIMALGVVTQALCVFFGSRSASLVGEDVFARLRLQFMTGAYAVPMGTLEAAGTGELVTRTTQDINSVSGTVQRALPETLIALSTVALTIVAAFATSPRVAIVYVLAVPVLVVVMRWYMRRAPGVYQRMGESYGPVYASMYETAGSLRTVAALGLRVPRRRSADAALENQWDAAIGRIKLRQVMLPWSNLAFAIPVAASLAWGGQLAIRGDVSIGTVVTVTLYAAAIVAPLESLIGWTDEIQRGFVSFARILGVSQYVDEQQTGSEVPRSTDVSLENVGFAYRSGRPVVHEVSLDTVPGERLAMIGPSGAGKSTLARVIAGIDRPTSGRALVGGVDAADIVSGIRPRHVLLVSQESHIFAATVLENVRLGRVDASDEEVRSALEKVGAAQWVDALDDGWESAVGSGGAPLSGAQEQQLALARVLVADPHTVILDEATAAMDPGVARDLERALGAALAGRTVIAIAHRLYTARDADRIAVIEAGRLVQLGSHDELLAEGGLYADLWIAWSNDGRARDV